MVWVETRVVRVILHNKCALTNKVVNLHNEKIAIQCKFRRDKDAVMIFIYLKQLFSPCVLSYFNSFLCVFPLLGLSALPGFYPPNHLLPLWFCLHSPAVSCQCD